MCIPLSSAAWPVARGGGGEGGAGQPQQTAVGQEQLCSWAAFLPGGHTGGAGWGGDPHLWQPPLHRDAAAAAGWGSERTGGVREGSGCSAGKLHPQQTSSRSSSEGPALNIPLRGRALKVAGAGLRSHGAASASALGALLALLEPASCWQLPGFVQGLKQLTAERAGMLN